MAGTAIVAVRRLSRPGPDRREPGSLWSNSRVSFAHVRPSGLVAAGGTRPAGRSQMGGRSSPHLSSRSGPSSSSTPGSENTGAPSGTRMDPDQPAVAGSGQPTSASSGQPASAWPCQPASVSLGGSGLVCRAAACHGVAGGRDRGAGRWYGDCGAAGRCSHWMPASLQSWWDRCHGEGPAVLGVAVLGVAGEAERLGWNPGPPARPRSAWVAPSARGAGFGVSGEDQDPSGSRRGEGTALAARQGLASGLVLAGPGGAGSRGSGPARASSPASWAGMLSGLALSGLALSGLATGGGC